MLVRLSTLLNLYLELLIKSFFFQNNDMFSCMICSRTQANEFSEELFLSLLKLHLGAFFYKGLIALVLKCLKI